MFSKQGRKTTVTGIVAIITSLGAMVAEPSNMTKPEFMVPLITGIINGIGLIFARDSRPAGESLLNQ